MSKIIKPLSIARSDFIQELTRLINESSLPAFVIEDTLKDIYADVRVLSKRQYEMDLKNYRDALSRDEYEDDTE